MSPESTRPVVEPSETTKRRATWGGLLLEGQQELRDGLGVDEDGFLRVAGPSHADSRGYLMYAVLDELLKTSASLLRWLRLLEEMEVPGAKADRFWTESIADEESLRIRKLVEALTDLICFRTSNEQAYYRHMLLLKELERTRATQQDLELFYACPSRNVASQVERLASELAELEASGSVDLPTAWYARDASAPRAPERLARLQPGAVLTSTRARLRHALPLAQPHERLALGVSYDRLFSRVSRDIHFTPDARRHPADVRTVSLGLDECGILGLNVLLAVQRLLDVAGGPRCEQVKRSFDDNPYPAELFDSSTRGTAKPGDFVLAYGDLAEVVNVAESDFGYVSYKVLYLAGSPLPDVPEDWFPAQTIRVLFSRSALVDLVASRVQSGEIPPELGERLTSPAGDEGFRSSVRELWQRGLRDHVLGRRTDG